MPSVMGLPTAPRCFRELFTHSLSFCMLVVLLYSLMSQYCAAPDIFAVVVMTCGYACM